MPDDQALRNAAFREVRRLADLNGNLTARDIAEGFRFDGQRIPLVNTRQGIFKPKEMRHLLSIRTVFAKPGARVWYEDQRNVYKQIDDGGETVDYAFMGQNPNDAENRWLRDAMEHRIPIIYFLGIAPAIYQAMIPTYVVGWDSKTLNATIAFPEQDVIDAPLPKTPAERRYGLRQVKQRLHQTSFRQAVISAYRGRCALSGLREPLLLDAAHIIEDKDERLGQPVIQNGLALAKTHHAAFDAHLIGIDPDSKIHLSDRLLEQRDGPTLEAMKRLHMQFLRPPAHAQYRPDRDRLALRFEKFKSRS